MGLGFVPVRRASCSDNDGGTLSSRFDVAAFSGAAAVTTSLIVVSIWCMVRPVERARARESAYERERACETERERARARTREHEREGERKRASARVCGCAGGRERAR